MSKAKVKAAETLEGETPKGAYRIVYGDGDEVFDLSFDTVERRDHEAARLRSSGIVCEKINPEE